jgi:hypothetical protein
VFSFQRVSGLPVIELADGPIPVNQLKIGAIVFQVAAHAIFAGRFAHLQPCVIAPPKGQKMANFLVTIEAFVRRLGGSKLMASRAVRGAVQRFMRF